MREIYDVIVIGAGIVGASIAAELSSNHRVLLLEREYQPGYHSTGRSAAIFAENYGNCTVRRLSRASRQAFTDQGSEVSSSHADFRHILIMSQFEHSAVVEELINESERSSLERVSAEDARDICPILNLEYARQFVVERQAFDIDVGTLLQLYVRRAKHSGCSFCVNEEVVELRRELSCWHVRTINNAYTAPIVVNAAGAWADQVALLANIGPLGLQPRRRTAILVEPPAGTEIKCWPMVVDAERQFYFKPDAGAVLISPGDETPSPPTDAQPDEYDVAVAASLVETSTTLEILRIRRRWAGLRTFLEDRQPAIGFDTSAEGFFWAAGLGGYGIQTAPAVSSLSARLICGDDIPNELSVLGFMAQSVDPRRSQNQSPKKKVLL